MARARLTGDHRSGRTPPSRKEGRTAARRRAWVPTTRCVRPDVGLGGQKADQGATPSRCMHAANLACGRVEAQGQGRSDRCDRTATLQPVEAVDLHRQHATARLREGKAEAAHGVNRPVESGRRAEAHNDPWRPGRESRSGRAAHRGAVLPRRMRRERIESRRLGRSQAQDRLDGHPSLASRCCRTRPQRQRSITVRQPLRGLAFDCERLVPDSQILRASGPQILADR